MHRAPRAVAVAAPGQAARFGTHPRLCVAYDGSPESDAAADAAYAIAAATASSVVLLHAVAPVAYAAGYAAVPVDLQAERTVRERAEAQLAEVADRAPEGVSVEQRAPDGPAARVILNVAQTGFDLLVVGSRHYGPMHRVLVGSVSAPLLTNGRVPVLVTARHGAADTPELDGTVVAVGA
jgi:nucleotide-binding universal stress UspA family protein